MTGAALPPSVDTVIRYEDLEMRAGLASVIVNHTDIKQGQNIHYQGRDKKKDDIVAKSGQLITPAIISLVASVGETELRVKKLPRIVIISSGDELVEVEQTPLMYQVRKSNNYTVKAILQENGIDAVMMHIPDNPEVTQKIIKECLQNFDVLLLSGGISAGKFDYIPKALEELQVEKLFYKVQQRPGKPFWFGKHQNGAVVFAFPGNPVATFMCMYRYFLPWLQATLGLDAKQAVYAVLNKDFHFHPELKYMLQVKLQLTQQGRLTASPIEGNGSGDFANLADTDAFMELPLEKNEFKKGEIYRIYSFKQIL
jgi:molybdopterin molybdotransferase